MLVIMASLVEMMLFVLFVSSCLLVMMMWWLGVRFFTMLSSSRCEGDSLVGFSALVVRLMVRLMGCWASGRGSFLVSTDVPRMTLRFVIIAARRVASVELVEAGSKPAQIS